MEAVSFVQSYMEAVCKRGWGERSCRDKLWNILLLAHPWFLGAVFAGVVLGPRSVTICGHRSRPEDPNTGKDRTKHPALVHRRVLARSGCIQRPPFAQSKGSFGVLSGSGVPADPPRLGDLKVTDAAGLGVLLSSSWQGGTRQHMRKHIVKDSVEAFERRFAAVAVTVGIRDFRSSSSPFFALQVDFVDAPRRAPHLQNLPAGRKREMRKNENPLNATIVLHRIR